MLMLPDSSVAKAKKLLCHWMTVFGHPVLFDCLEKSEETVSEKAPMLFDCLEPDEDTASEKTPMQWHISRNLNFDYALASFNSF